MIYFIQTLFTILLQEFDQQLQNANNLQNSPNSANTQLFAQKNVPSASSANASKPASQTNTPGSTPVNNQTNSPFNFNTPKTVQKSGENPVEKPVAKPNIFATPAESQNQLKPSPAPIGPPKPETPKATFMFAKPAEQQVETPTPTESKNSSSGKPFKCTSPIKEQNSTTKGEKDSFSFSMSPSVKNNTKKSENSMVESPQIGANGNMFVEQKPSFMSPLIKNNATAPVEAAAAAGDNNPKTETSVLASTDVTTRNGTEPASSFQDLHNKQEKFDNYEAKHAKQKNQQLNSLKEGKETGEENEECLFSERAKLYRFVEDEWTVRGIGNLRILANKADNSKQRIVMRREVSRTLCAKHFLRQGMSTITREG